MRITYDAQTRAAYIHLRDTPVFLTRSMTNWVNVDLDVDAYVVGVELLDVDLPVVEILDADPPADR